MLSSELIQPSHQQRQALIYLRQSSPGQLQHNRESLALQYALRDRARASGWPADAIEIIDADLGLTGRSAAARPGFLQLVQRVSLGQVGIIFAYDVTRFARNCTDWYQLLDLCGVRACLVGDQDGIYDPASANGRLLLGLKGLISELELHTIRARLTAGLLHKAQRGELALPLPAGLLRDELGRVVKHPDREVQDRLQLIFTTFLRCKSIRRVVRYFHDHDLPIPRRTPEGGIAWRRASVSAIGSTLHNPAYAGCFVYGRRRTLPAGAPQRCQRVPLDEWKIRVPDCYPAYIRWETFVTIQTMIRDNASAYQRQPTRGVPRPGQALLHGLVYCAVCGRQLLVHYNSGTHYVCSQAPACQRMVAPPVDDAVVAAFWQVLQPAQLDLWQQAQHHLEAEQAELQRNQQQQLQRLRYQARLAERQYQQTDPDNRLVAAELEKRWEEALRQLQRAEQTCAPQTQPAASDLVITDEVRALWQQAGAQLPELWQQGRLSPEQKKALLRCLIDKVVVERTPAATVKVRIVWKGGEASQQEVPIRVAARKALPFAKQMEQEIVRFARQGKTDDWIARQMQRRGYRSALRSFVPLSVIRAIRLRHQIPPRRTPRGIPGYYTPRQLARRLHAPVSWIELGIQNGTIQVELHEEWQRFLFPATAETLRKFRSLRAGKVGKLWF